VNVSKVVTQVVELTSPCWRDIPESRGLSINVQTDVPENLPGLYCNESELREALTNLVLNAVDAMPEGGVITFAARQISSPRADARKRYSGHLSLEVTDTGIGMDENTRQRCLEPFFSTKRQRGGSGLGLAMVYGTMQRHEGRIEIQSAVGKGTTITLIFPLREEKKPVSMTAAGAGNRKSEGMRVLCIDDEPMLRNLLKEVLDFHHLQAETAETGEAGLDLFYRARESGRAFDAVITDLGMPGINGRQVAERIKSVSPQTPVILLTGWGAMMDQDETKFGRLDAVLCKPPHVNELIQTIERVTAGAEVRVVV
jgi:CheY-like chemotaxis protein